MPTVNPRINVTLSPGLDALVQRMADLQRVSKSHVVRELLESSAPLLSNAVRSMEHARQAVEALHEFSADYESLDGPGRLVVKDGGIFRTWEPGSDLVEIAEAVKERRPRRRGDKGEPEASASHRVRASSAAPGRATALSNPPASNRGVKSKGEGVQQGASSPLKVVKGGRDAL